MDDKIDGASWPVSKERFRAALVQAIGLAERMAGEMALAEFRAGCIPVTLGEAVETLVTLEGEEAACDGRRGARPGSCQMPSRVYFAQSRYDGGVAAAGLPAGEKPPTWISTLRRSSTW